MKKKLFSAICAFVIAVSQCGMAFAAEEPEEIEEINIVDEAVSEEIEESEEDAVLLDSSDSDDATSQIDEIEEDALLLLDGTENETEITEITEETDGVIEPAEINLMGGIFLAGAPALDMNYRYRTSKNGASSATYSQLKSFGFSEDKLTYNIFLPDNTQYAYLSVALPDGAVVEAYTVNGDNSDLLGASEMSLTSTYQYKMKNPVLTETIDAEAYYIIPVKNEYGSISIAYTKDSVTTDYKVNFFASQPKLTSFTQYADTNICFTGGAAANNDNGTIIDSAADSTVIRALSNISKKLVGSSVFMLPISKMKATNSWFIKNKNDDMFSFSADHAGTVYVMTYAANSANFNSDNGWQTVNNGTTGTGVTISSTSGVARTKNDYTNTDYFAGMYGWKCLKENENFTGANRNRVNRLTGTLSTSYVDSNATKTLKYVYSKDFAAGDTVTIPVPNEMSTSWQGMAVLVQWDADIDESVISFTEADIPGDAVFRILYSEDDVKYTKILNFDENNSYTVNFENNVEFAYIKLRLPESTSAVVESSNKTISVTDGYYLVPITGGSETVTITYKDELSAETVYTVTFTAPQNDSAIAMQYAGGANISFISGAAIGSDGCILSTEYNQVDKIENKLTASAALQGGSVFVLPLEEMRSKNSWTLTHPDEDMFTFVPDAAGRVYVITDSKVLFNSEYELLWDVESGLKGALVTVKTDLQNGSTKTETVNLNYVYSYEFAKDEEVGIPVPEVEEWKGNMAVVIKWQ